MSSRRTLYDKLWDAHHVAKRDDGSSLIYIDRHLIHEVTSPQAFDGLRERKIEPWRVDTIIATPDHNVPTENRAKGLKGISDSTSKLQVLTLEENVKKYDLNLDCIFIFYPSARLYMAAKLAGIKKVFCY